MFIAIHLRKLSRELMFTCNRLVREQSPLEIRNAPDTSSEDPKNVM